MFKVNNSVPQLTTA